MESEELKPKAGPLIVRVSDVERLPVDWLWPGKVPIGKVTLFAGDPSLGKSFITLDMVARVSVGRPWPDAPHEPVRAAGTCVILSAEDDLNDTIAPRLDVAGADTSRVIALQAVRWLDPANQTKKDVPICLDTDLVFVEKVLTDNPDTSLLVIDPVSAYLGKADSHINAEVRAVLAPLSEMAARHRVAIVCVQHLNKNTGGSAKYRVSGSLAFVAAARAVWLFAADKHDPIRRYMLPAKCNLAREVDGLAYRIVPSTDDPKIGTVEWEAQPVDVSADDALADDDRHAERDEAAGWLREVLTGGPVEQREITKLGKSAGFAERLLRRAKEHIKATSVKEGFGKTTKWYWRLPVAGSLRRQPLRVIPNGPLSSLSALSSSSGNEGAEGAEDDRCFEPENTGALDAADAAYRQYKANGG